jgi:DNA-3-methyladenine glycosylase
VLQFILVKSLEKCYSSSFYARPTTEVARDLLGATLCRRLTDGSIYKGQIVELEAYHEDEPACHAHRGKTPRSAILFGPPGMAYVYFIYGMYSCLNVVTEPEGVGAAILIRAVGAAGTDGPGKLCREWEISRAHNGFTLMSSRSDIWIERAPKLADEDVVITPRIGISSAQDLMWRFCVKNHPSVSVKKYRPHKPLKRRTYKSSKEP